MNAHPPVTPPACPVITQAVADNALRHLQARLAGTRFVSARPAGVPCLVAAQMASGQTTYTNASATYWFNGVIFDLKTGVMLDNPGFKQTQKEQ